MKAFEEWYEEEIKDKGKDYWLPWPSAAKMGWRAALEWVWWKKSATNEDYERVFMDIEEELEGPVLQ